ncbi:MAG: hypothetical protein V3R58_08850 [candidate division NC10 bacterium]
MIESRPYAPERDTLFKNEPPVMTQSAIEEAQRETMGRHRVTIGTPGWS